MNTISIGRISTNQIVLNDEFVSRKHARLFILDNGQVMIKDLGSSNGTFVNGSKISESFLLPGDIVKCASVYLNWSQYINSDKVKAVGSVKYFSSGIENKPAPSQSETAQNQNSGIPKACVTQSTNKGIIITVAIILILAFFMPWINVFANLSAYDIVFGRMGEFINTSFRYIVVLIPISGILIIYASAFNNENYIISKSVLFGVPLTTLIVIGIVVAIKASEDVGGVVSPDFEKIIKIFGIGFWLTLACAITLPTLSQNSTKNAASTSLANTALAKGGLTIIAMGFILMIISSQNQLFTKKERYRVDPAATMGLPQAFDIMGPMYDTRTILDNSKKKAYYNGGLILLIAGGVLFVFGRNKS